MGMWFTSDPHFGHAKVALDRGFATVQAHDMTIRRNFLRMVQPNDTVFWLGDIAFGDWRKNLGYIGGIPGEHILILGNHDRAHPLHSNAWRYHQDFLQAGFAAVDVMGKVRYEGQRFMLSHFPYDGDHPRSDGDDSDRATQYRVRDEGRPIIHGHTHSKQQFSRSALGTPQVCVSLDAWGMKPASFHAVYTLVKENS